MARLNSGCSIIRMTASARRPVSPGGTSRPSFSGSIRSRGPHGHSNATQGTPHAIASTSTMPNPSKREENTSMEDCSSFSCTSEVAPRRNTCLSSPFSRTRFSRDSFSGPSPHISSSHPGWTAATFSHARIKRSNPLTGTRRPTATARGRSKEAVRSVRRMHGFGITCTPFLPFQFVSISCRVSTTVAS